MSTELFISLEEILTKIKINGYLKNVTDNNIEEFNIKGIKNKNKITYMYNETKYDIKIMNNTKVILQRENKEMKHTFIFEPQKDVISQYLIKNNLLNLEINIKVLSMIIEPSSIFVSYLIKETNAIYEYKIEMSENI